MNESKLYRPAIERAAKEAGIDPDLLEAIVRIESSGLAHSYRYEPAYFDRYLKDDPAYVDANPRRVSASYGLCQVMYPTARALGYWWTVPELLFIPSVSLHYGAAELARLIKLFPGSHDKAITAYNTGPGNVNSTAGAIYLNKILTALAEIRAGR